MRVVMVMVMVMVLVMVRTVEWRAKAARRQWMSLEMRVLRGRTRMRS
jgi:hypothetical protein